MLSRFRFALLCAAFASFGVPSFAQEYGEIAYYNAQIGAEDFRNSSGARLSGLGAVMQQDRANYHRFGIRHAGDSSDPVFGDRATRARIPALYQNGYVVGSLESKVSQGQPFNAGVFVCGFGSVPSVIFIVPAGQDHSGCF